MNQDLTIEVPLLLYQFSGGEYGSKKGCNVKEK